MLNPRKRRRWKRWSYAAAYSWTQIGSVEREHSPEVSRNGTGMYAVLETERPEIEAAASRLHSRSNDLARGSSAC